MKEPNALTKSFKISIWIEEGRERKIWLLCPPEKVKKAVTWAPFFVLFVLLAYLSQTQHLLPFDQWLFWVIERWGWFLYGVRVKREARDMGTERRNRRHSGRWKSLRRVEFTAGEDIETQHKSRVNQPILVPCGTTCFKNQVSVVAATCVHY